MNSRLNFIRATALNFARKYLVSFGWWLVGMLICATLAALTPKINSTSYVRGFGMWLQLFGVSLVIYGIAQSRQFFGKPGFWKSISVFLEDFIVVFRKPKVVNASVNVNIGGVSAVATAGVIRANSTFEQRLEELENLTRRMQATMDKQYEELAESINEKVSTERNERTEGHQKISGQIETVAIGSAALQLGGALYIMSGVILTSIPDEIVALI